MVAHKIMDTLEDDPEKGEQNTASETRRKGFRNRTMSMLKAREPAEPLPERRLRRDILPRKGHAFTFDEDDIFQTTLNHVKYTHNGTTLTGLEKYWDCTEYGITDPSERHLLRLEVHRVIEAAKTQDAMLLNLGQHLGAATDTAFTEISQVADQIRCGSEIISLDAARVSLEHCDSNMEETVDTFRTARRRLRGRFARGDSSVQGSEPKYLLPPARNQAVYFAMVDYITASVVRLIVRTVWSKWSNRQLLSTLAAWSTKLKVLSYDLAKYARYSIETAEHAIEQLGQSFASKQAMIIRVRLKPDAKAEDVETLDTETDVSGRYHQEHTFFNGHIRELLKVILVDLNEVNETQRLVGSFETCAIVYKAGLDGTLTTLSCDRMGYISASSDPFRLKCSSVALELVKSNLVELKALTELATSSSATVTGPQARLRLEWSDSEDSKDSQVCNVLTGDINHIISTVVPLSLASTFASNILDGMMGVLVSGTPLDDPILQFEPPERGFRALVAVSTSNWIARERSLVRLQHKDEDVRNLPQSPLGHTIRAGTNNFRAITRSDALSQQTAPSSNDTKRLARYKAERNEMDRWVIAESSVTIRCVLYVRCVMALTIAIVCGSMSIPFIVGQRIRGVDPFQLTTFAWFLAGFVAIFAKSRYVSEWPWHDFLHGRVVCTSISDVVDVTRLKPQTVLTYLLLEEQTTTLRTKGPYNGMFLRKTDDSSGFAIDEAADTYTMLASGFVLLKVLDESGEHIICLDVRKGTKGRAPIPHSNEEYVACMNLENYEDPRAGVAQPNGEHQAGGGSGGSRFQLTGKGRHTVKVKKLTKTKFSINRVLGVYVGMSRFG